jgi:hypothetical protein
MILRGRTFVLLLLAGFGTPASGDAQQEGRWAGTYDTEVELIRSTCADVTIRPGPTIITHRGSADSMQLEHAGQMYQGSVTPDSGFVLQPRELTFGRTIYRIAIEGRFGDRGLTARVTVDQRDDGAGTSCQYVVGWKAHRSD